MAGEDERYREQRDGPCPRLVWATGDETPAAGIDSGPSETASTPGIHDGGGIDARTAAHWRLSDERCCRCC